LLNCDGAAHLLTMAPTRSGKGVGTIIPNLLLLDRSVICIDPKDGNARVTARARAAKGKVWCLIHSACRVSPLPATIRSTGSTPPVSISRKMPTPYDNHRQLPRTGPARH